MKKNIILAFTFLLFALTIQAQQHYCGTSVETQLELRQRLIQNRTNAAHQDNAGQREVEYYIPVKVHIVGRSDGTNFTYEPSVLDMICNLNNEYEDQDIQFYLKMPFNYIESDALYGDPQGTAGGFQIQQHKVNSAINIFIIGSFSGNPNLLAYYQGPAIVNDFIVIKKSAIFGSAAPHEVGHFFSLPHPFFGWENNAWNASTHGNPVGSTSPLGFLNEKVDQSNCTQAADAICDTPPDYLFAFSNGQNGCNPWNGGAMDPNGEVVDPMEVNMMSYFAPCSEYQFTTGQKDAIIADLESFQRNYIRPDYTPSVEEITETPVLVSPINGETTEFYNKVTFNWEAVSGAQFYFLEVDFQPTFGANPQRYIIEGATSKTIEDYFTSDRDYYWRVRPFGEYVTCGTPFSTTGALHTSILSATYQIAAVNGWTVRPNPISTQQVLNVEIEAQQSFDAQINLYNTAGQLMKTIDNRNFGIGVNTVELSVAGLNPGLYFITISSEEGVLNKKVIITK